ncbi:class I SAM-dependent methyltransferase [Geoalkalibacter sp.]|jgi:SAM-dependent methyltransferase|uniref:class I SAM-dependent methyltransferase n=1 Tax=Geoalkalibacter sp. TaxID=3041440 RepID=UPI00272E78D6|nr:class I SAM-dependent methyltransferase [Geoalkalibacter sp.]
MSSFKDHFSATADQYRVFRPTYPAALFEWLARIAPAREAALDCGCGNGQAAVLLAPHFKKVFAVDPSREQILNAMPRENLTYLVAPAEATGLADGSIDLAVAGQALHWFDFERFYPEMRRVVRAKGGIFAAFTYGLIELGGAVDEVIGTFYHETLAEYWPPERRHVDSGYQSLPFPFPEINAPAFELVESWDLSRLTGYLSTWSAVKEYRRRTGIDPLPAVAEELSRAWGVPAIRRVCWPLALRVGKVN